MRRIEVDARALKQVLLALTGPPHLIRELQAVVNLGDSPIAKLVDEYNTALEEHKKEKSE